MVHNKSNASASKSSTAPKKKKRKDISFDDISQYFDLPIKEAAEKLSVSLTQLKRICRAQEIPRWPFRKLQSIQNKIDDLTEMIEKTDQCTRFRIENKIEAHRQEMSYIKKFPKSIGAPSNFSPTERKQRRNSIQKNKRWSLPSALENLTDSTSARRMSIGSEGEGSGESSFDQDEDDVGDYSSDHSSVDSNPSTPRGSMNNLSQFYAALSTSNPDYFSHSSSSFQDSVHLAPITTVSNDSQFTTQLPPISALTASLDREMELTKPSRRISTDYDHYKHSRTNSNSSTSSAMPMEEDIELRLPSQPRFNQFPTSTSDKRHSLSPYVLRQLSSVSRAQFNSVPLHEPPPIQANNPPPAPSWQPQPSFFAPLPEVALPESSKPRSQSLTYTQPGLQNNAFQLQNDKPAPPWPLVPPYAPPSHYQQSSLHQPRPPPPQVLPYLHQPLPQPPHLLHQQHDNLPSSYLPPPSSSDDNQNYQDYYRQHPQHARQGAPYHEQQLLPSIQQLTASSPVQFDTSHANMTNQNPQQHQPKSLLSMLKSQHAATTASRMDSSDYFKNMERFYPRPTPIRAQSYRHTISGLPHVQFTELQRQIDVQNSAASSSHLTHHQHNNVGNNHTPLVRAMSTPNIPSAPVNTPVHVQAVPPSSPAPTSPTSPQRKPMSFLEKLFFKKLPFFKKKKK